MAQQRRLSAWWRALVTTLLLECLARGAAWNEPLACEVGGYCSRGKVQPYHGDLAQQGAVAEALQARSFQKEVLFIAFTGAPAHAGLGLQLLSNLHSMGYEHTVVLMDSEESCSGRLPASVMHLLYGCVWHTLDLPQLVNPLWHKRARFIALAVRHGYNIMHLDSDTAAFSDPYIHLKTNPQLSTYKLIIQIDPFGWSGLNSGLFYVQNARPDGPVAWLLAEVADRMLRFAEAPELVHKRFPWIQSGNLLDHVVSDDQTHLRDTVLSAMAGRPVFANVIPGPPDGRPFDLLGAVHKLPRNQSRIVIPQPQGWLLSFKHISDYAMLYDLRMPNCNGEWPEHLGGQLLGPRGRYSLKFQEELMAGSTHPMWPDPYDGSQASKAAELPHELYSFGPDWLFSSYPGRGMDGLWDPIWTRGRPQQAIGHMLMGAGEYKLAKTLVRQGLGMFNWSMERAVLGHEPLWAWTHDAPLPRLLAYHPEVMQRLRPDKIEDFQLLSIRLLQAARLMRRTVVWPLLRCDSRAVPHDMGIFEPRKDSFPFRYLPDVYVFGLLSPMPPNPIMCLWSYFIFPECLFGGKGVTPLELRYLVEERQEAGYWPAGPDNTLFAVAGGLDAVSPPDYGEGGVTGLLGAGMVLEDGFVLLNEGTPRQHEKVINPNTMVAREFPVGVKMTPAQILQAEQRAAQGGRDRVVYLASVPELEPADVDALPPLPGGMEACEALRTEVAQRYKEWNVYWDDDGKAPAPQR